jgi:anti-sigma factor RsiW
MSSPRVTYEDLLAYAAGSCSPDQSQRIEAYLSVNPDAAATVARYRAARSAIASDDTVAPPESVLARARAVFTAAPPQRLAWLDRAATILARLVYDSRVQPAAVRFVDAGQVVQLAFEVNDSEIDVRAERMTAADDPQRPARWRVMGQCSGARSLAGCPVSMIQRPNGAPAAEGSADDRSVFVLEVDPGDYDIVVQHHDGSIVLPGVRLA